MADNSFRQINGPQGPINFPASMDDDQVAQAMRRLYPPKQAAAPKEDIWSKVGAYVPEAATAPLTWSQKHLIEPFERMAQTGGEIGKAAFPAMLRNMAPESALAPQRPVAKGAAEGVGSVVGSMVADPRNWPLMGEEAARPILRAAMKYGFSAMMAKGTYDSAKQLHDNWDKLTPQQRAELGTQSGISALMTAGVIASKGHPAPRPEETTIAATGKTGPEAKAGAKPSSPSTGLGVEELRARLKAVEERIAAERAAKTVAGTPSVVEPIQKILDKYKEQGTYFGPKAARDLPGVEDVSKYPAQAGKGVEVPGVVDPKEAVKKVAEKPAPIEAAPLPKAPEARPEPPPKQPIASKSYSGYQIIDGRKPEPIKQTIPERPAGLNATSPEAVAEARQRQALRDFQLKTTNEATSRSTSGSKVGRQAAPPEATQPEVQPLQTTQTPAPSGEPVLPPETPAISEPRSLRGDLGERPSADHSLTDAGVARHTQAVEQARAELGVRPGEYHKDLMKRANDIELEMRAKPAEKRVLNAQDRLQLAKERAVELQKKYPNISKTRIQEMAAEQIKKEQGSLGGGPPEDRNLRREYKINEWVRKLQDPEAKPGDIDTAFKMLRAYGLEADEIIRRVSGADRFAKTGQEGDRLPEPSKEALEERIGDPRKFLEDAKASLSARNEDALESIAQTESRRQGNEAIRGVKSPATEELDRMAALKDPRKFGREDERGSLSFKPISEEERKSANPVRRLADALDRVANFFDRRGLSDEEAARQQQTKNIIRGAAAEKARSHLEVQQALDDAIQRHDNPTNERENFVKFMDAGEGKPGAQFLTPKDQAMAEVLHEMFDERWEKVKEVKGLEGDGIENYLAHIWEKADKAQKRLTGILTGKRPLEGSAKFLKNRFYQYASEGIENGLTPVTWNPVRLQLAALFDVDRFLMAHDIKDQFKDAGLVRWVKLAEYKDVPPGWQRLDDRIFQPKLAGDGALKEYGTYYAPPEVAKVFNRYLSPGLGLSPIYRNVRQYANTLNMATLGISGYHGTMISLVSATSDLALGMQKVLNYGDLGGMKDALRGTVGTFILRSAARDYRLGRSIQAEAIDPTGNPSLQKYVDAIVQGGGRFKQDPFYANTMADRKGFVNWLKLAPQGKFQEMVFTGVRSISGPIMDKFVPRVKLGVASRMMEAKLGELQKQGITDENTIATEMGKIWDSVDNRAGQMVYDNLFWNKAAKDLSFLAVRAVGWDLGSIREYGGGVAIDLPRQAAKALRGERPELTSRLAFTIATPITIGLFGGMVHYIMTGKAPQRQEDYFFPGPDGAKVSFPTYMKDYYSFKDHPLKTAANKLNPLWGQLSDLYSNSDFYGNEIIHPGDDKLKQGWDVLKWYSKSFVPFSITGIVKRIERGEPISSATTGFFGFMPAPASVSQTKAEQLSSELSKREWKQGPRTSADAARYALVQKFQHQVGSGQKIDMNELTQAWKDRRIQDSDISKIYSNFNVPKLQREFKGLHLPDALAVMREADSNERVQLKPFLLQKYGELERYPVDQQKAYAREIRAYFQ